MANSNSVFKTVQGGIWSKYNLSMQICIVPSRYGE